MRTSIGNALIEQLDAEAKRLEDSAKYAALLYANSDDPAHKQDYRRLSFAAEELRKQRLSVVQAVAALEALLPEPLPPPKR